MTTKKKSSSAADHKSKKRARTNSGIGLFFKVLLLMILMIFLGIFVFFYVKYGRTLLHMQRDAKNYVWSSTKDTFRQYETSLFFDATGEPISSLSGERELYYVKYEDIPTKVIDAVVTIEDKRYFEHEGVDYIANVRAAIALIKHKGKVTQGASTITQQLARNIFLSNEVSIERKIKEIFIASEMEKKYSKRQILEFYLNNIYYANGYYGIQAAANGYFQKSISDLTLSEAAFLCAIPNSPTLFNPVTNIKNTYKRRNRILKQMYEDGLIEKKEYEKAVKEKNKVRDQDSGSHNYVETYVYQCTIEALMRDQGFEFQTSFSSEDARKAYNESYQELYTHYQALLYTGGYRVYTSINLKKQEELQAALDQNLASFTQTTEDGIYELQGSAVCINNETGKVTAIVGGRSQDGHKYTLNRAYQSFRQPGSAVKPLIVYGPYFDQGHNPEELVDDIKTEDGPKNSNGVYSGEITIRTAVEQSKNTVAWTLFEELTPERGLSYLKHMNFKKLDSKDQVLAASLGGFTYGTNTLEMAGAYAALENDGIYREPDCIVKIMDSNGDLAVEPETNEEQVYTIQTARIMTDVLTGVLKTGTGKGLGLGSMPAAAKTGTTSDKKDGWFVGYTKYYTTSVWVGYDYPKTMADLYGSTYPGKIWRDYMETIHEGLEPEEFEGYIDTWSQTPEEEEPEEENPEDGENEQPGEEEDSKVNSAKPTKPPKPTAKPTAEPDPTSEPSKQPPEDSGETVTPGETSPEVTEPGNGSEEDSQDPEGDQKEPLEEPEVEEDPGDDEPEEEYENEGNSSEGDVYYSNGQVYYPQGDDQEE